MSQEHVETFIQQAEAASCIVRRTRSMDEALGYALKVCAQREPCRPLPLGTDRGSSDKERILAVPDLDGDQYTAWAGIAQGSGIRLIRSGLRAYAAGIDLGFVVAHLGLAATGTLVLESKAEDVRLATMISEVNVLILPLSRLRADALAAEEELASFMRRPPGYLAFITGPSRTADIERVLTLGVHGPLEVHVLLWEDA